MKKTTKLKTIALARFPSDYNREIANLNKKGSLQKNAVSERFRGRDKIKITNNPCEVGRVF